MNAPNVNPRGMTQLIFCLALLFLAGMSSLSAQGPPGEHKVRFRTLGLQVAADDLHYDLKNQEATVFVTEAARSIFFDAPKEKQIVFFRQVPGPDDKKVREIAATVDITKAGPMPLLLFMADPAAPNHYQVTAIPDDPKSFPFPFCRFVNLTELVLDGSYGDEKFKLAHKGMALIDSRLKPNAGPQARIATLSVNAPQGPQLLYSNNWAVRPNCRTLAFLLPQGQGLSVVRITDDISMFNVPSK